MIEIEKQALIQTKRINTTKIRREKMPGIVMSLLNITTPVTYEKYATWFPDEVVVSILQVFLFAAKHSCPYDKKILIKPCPTGYCFLSHFQILLSHNLTAWKRLVHVSID